MITLELIPLTEPWVTLQRIFSTEKDAAKAARILTTTESRLSSIPGGPQYDIETEIFEVATGWQVRWRKVFAGIGSGCGGCGSCGPSNPGKAEKKQKGEVIQFKPRKV